MLINKKGDTKAPLGNGLQPLLLQKQETNEGTNELCLSDNWRVPGTKQTTKGDD